MSLIVLLFVCGLTAAPADGQVATRMAASVDRMQSAMEKQRASVRKQVAPGAEGVSGFFTTPWQDMPRPQIATTAALSTDQALCEPVSADEVRKMVAEAAAAEGVNPLVLRAMIHRESGGRACAVSVKGAQGLMQLMPATAADLGVHDPFEPRANVLGGARYLKQMLERYNGNLRLALAAYNAGPQRVPPAGPIPSISETQAYVAAIMAQLGVNGDEAE